MVSVNQQAWPLWTPPAGEPEPSFQALRFDRSQLKDNEDSLFREWIARAFDELRAHVTALNKASEFKKTNEADPTISEFETLSDDDQLKLIDKLATVSSIHSAWADDIRGPIEMLEWVKNNHPSLWNSEAQRLVGELKQHLSLFEWVRDVTWKWSDEVGQYFDRNHPDLPHLPFTPIDMGPSDSSRLPPVL
jgi:hypothetical protein